MKNRQRNLANLFARGICNLASGLTKLKHALQIEQSKTNKCYDALDNKINQTLLDASNCYLN